MTNANDAATGCTHGGATDEKLRGLTKREYFAAMALACYSEQHASVANATAWSLSVADLLIAKLNGE